VINQAPVLRPMVIMATTTEAHNKVRGDHEGNLEIIAFG
jgi:hypothetical protein